MSAWQLVVPGTDVAMEAADVTLISGDIRKVAQAIALSKLTVRGIKLKFVLGFFLQCHSHSHRHCRHLPTIWADTGSRCDGIQFAVCGGQ